MTTASTAQPFILVLEDEADIGRIICSALSDEYGNRYMFTSMRLLVFYALVFDSTLRSAMHHAAFCARLAHEIFGDCTGLGSRPQRVCYRF